MPQGFSLPGMTSWHPGPDAADEIGQSTLLHPGVRPVRGTEVRPSTADYVHARFG